jgi:hypothetical protein
MRRKTEEKLQYRNSWNYATRWYFNSSVNAFMIVVVDLVMNGDDSILYSFNRLRSRKLGALLSIILGGTTYIILQIMHLESLYPPVVGFTVSFILIK